MSIGIFEGFLLTSLLGLGTSREEFENGVHHRFSMRGTFHYEFSL